MPRRLRMRPRPRTTKCGCFEGRLQSWTRRRRGWRCMCRGTAGICFSVTGIGRTRSGEGGRESPVLRDPRTDGAAAGRRNVLAALVLDMSRVAHRPAHLGAPCSVMTSAGGFVLDGVLRGDGAAGGGERGAAVVGDDVSTDAKWNVAVDTAHRFQNEGTTFEGYQGYFEHRVSKLIPEGGRPRSSTTPGGRRRRCSIGRSCW